MAAKAFSSPAEGYVQTPHPVHGLPRVVRHITGHDVEGKSVFLSTDIGDHHRELVNKSAIANIIYSTREHPVDLNGDVDVKHSRENEPGITSPSGSVCRMIDFAPGAISPLHRVSSLDYAIVIEGLFKLVLDSGEERIMQRGDVAVQRSTSHQWINVTGNGLLPARILFVLLDIKELRLSSGKGEGEKVGGFLGVLGRDYVGLPGHEGDGEEEGAGAGVGVGGQGGKKGEEEVGGKEGKGVGGKEGGGDGRVHWKESKEKENENGAAQKDYYAAAKNGVNEDKFDSEF